MSELLDKESITESICGSNFTYLLENNLDFLPTEYKVLQNQGNVSFVKCMKMSINGKIGIYYLTGNLKPLSSLISNLDSNGFIKIVSSLISNVINAKSIGFLSCNNIDISFEKIFVDTSTLKVSLVYLPINKHFFPDYLSFETQLRSSLIKLINSVHNLSSNKAIQLANDLSNGMLTLEDVLQRLKDEFSVGIGTTNVSSNNSSALHSNNGLHIIALNAPQYFELFINKPQFVIGKKASAVDGCIPFNNMISRIHCRIDNYDNNYTIIDLGSANGTFVNKKRIETNRPYPIKDSDIIRLANSDFQVKIN